MSTMTTERFWLSFSLLSLGVFTLESFVDSLLFYIIFVVGDDEINVNR